MVPNLSHVVKVALKERFFRIPFLCVFPRPSSVRCRNTRIIMIIIIKRWLQLLIRVFLLWCQSKNLFAYYRVHTTRRTAFLNLFAKCWPCHSFRLSLYKGHLCDCTTELRRPLLQWWTSFSFSSSKKRISWIASGWQNI